MYKYLHTHYIQQSRTTTEPKVNDIDVGADLQLKVGGKSASNIMQAEPAAMFKNWHRMATTRQKYKRRSNERRSKSASLQDNVQVLEPYGNDAMTM
jgi:hypothetical protein